MEQPTYLPAKRAVALRIYLQESDFIAKSGDSARAGRLDEPVASLQKPHIPEAFLQKQVCVVRLKRRRLVSMFFEAG